MDDEDLKRARDLVVEVMPTLLILNREGVFPYQLTDGEQISFNFSMSTNSMISHALAVTGGYLADSVIAVCHNRPDGAFTESHKKALKKALERIAERIRLAEPPADPYSSSTFGKADPMTVGWLAELLKLLPAGFLDEGDASRVKDHLADVAKQRIVSVLTNFRDPKSPVLDFSESQDYSVAVRHPMPVLRIIQIALLTKQDISPWSADVFDWFHRELQLQVSRQGIEYSEFDVAELVFCLEGMLAVDASKVTQPVIDRVAASVADVQRLNPTLRPITPFKTSRAGAVHLFSSVEVFSSLLRSAKILDCLGRHEFFQQIKPALRDYLSWLQGTKLSGRPKPGNNLNPVAPLADLKFVGWQSEYAHTDNRSIDVWLTSIVITFLHGYELLLGGEVARVKLRAAGLAVEVPRFNGSTRPAHASLAAEVDPFEDASLDSPYRVASRLVEDFVDTRRTGNKGLQQHSCLLYGPPGTGKTWLAQWLARQLGWPMLTVTTSDFIIDGDARVEARAKSLFEALEKQNEMVVFFDEIDRLILDRSLSTYSDQGDMLQFMTPSMLTKLNNLRAEERVIFLIGTNYADRIDSAIKRAGRIDQRLLVLPPDLKRRRSILGQAVTEYGLDEKVDEKALEAAAVEAVWRTRAELRAAVRRVAARGGDLVAHIKAFLPQVSLLGYQRRIEAAASDGADRDVSGFPNELIEEAFMIAYLLGEAKPDELVRYPWLWNYWTNADESLVRDPAIRQRIQDFYLVSTGFTQRNGR